MHPPTISGLESFVPLSQSSTAVTWRAYQRSLDRHVMVKMLLTEAVADHEQVERFISVARTIARIKAEALCQIYDVFSSGETHYVVMEDAAGQTLADLVQANPRVPVSTVLRLALNVADALGKAWGSARFVHRNLKPTTIHITPGGTAKLTDFGMAILATPEIDTALLDSGMIVGTPNFIAPEQVDHAHPIDHRTDMYALGAVLYFAFTGQIPFGEQPPEQVVRSQLEALLPNPRNIRPEIPLSVCALLERLLMKHPGNRYATWDAVVSDVNKLLEGKPIRRSPLLGTGLSTLAAPVGATDSDLPRQNAIPFKHATRPGGFIRFTLWSVLYLWLALLANHRIGDPADLYGRLRASFPDFTHYLPVLPEAAPARPVRPPSASAPAVVPTSVAHDPKPRPQPPTPALTVKTVETRSTDVPPDDAFYRSLADAYKTGGTSGMQAFASARLAAGYTHPQFRAVRDALATVEPLDRLVTRALEQAKETEISLVFQGKTRTVVPKSVSNGEVTLFFGEQNRHITLKIASIDNAEMIRLLGKSLTPSQSASVCFRLLETGHPEDARGHAAASGALAPVLNLLANE